MKTNDGYAVLNFEVDNFSSFRDIKKNHFVTAEAVAVTVADIDDNIEWKRIRVSLKNGNQNLEPEFLLDFYTHQMHILHRVGAVHLATGGQTDARTDRHRSRIK